MSNIFHKVMVWRGVSLSVALACAMPAYAGGGGSETDSSWPIYETISHLISKLIALGLGAF